MLGIETPPIHDLRALCALSKIQLISLIAIFFFIEIRREFGEIDLQRFDGLGCKTRIDTPLRQLGMNPAWPVTASGALTREGLGEPAIRLQACLGECRDDLIDVFFGPTFSRQLGFQLDCRVLPPGKQPKRGFARLGDCRASR